MKIATWNINGIKSRLDHVIKWCQVVDPDVLCLQETKIVDDKFPFQQLRSIGFDHIVVQGEKSYNGVAILSKQELKDPQLNLADDGENAPKRFLAATINGIRVVNVYVPHGTALGTEKFDLKLEWIRRLRKYFDLGFAPEEDVILCGDLNIAPHEMDVWNPRFWKDRVHFTKPEREALLDLKKWGFIDVFRQVNPEPGEYTWWDNFRHSFEKNRGLRIDHVWASPSVADSCRNCWIDRTPRGWERPSDHAPVVAEFSV